MPSKKKVYLTILACIAIAILIQAFQTYQAIALFGKEDQAVFNRSMEVSALNFLILSISVLIFFFNRLVGLAIACTSSIFASACIYILSGNIEYANGWFVIIPIAGMVAIVAFNTMAKKNA